MKEVLWFSLAIAAPAEPWKHSFVCYVRALAVSFLWPLLRFANDFYHPAFSQSLKRPDLLLALMQARQ